MRPAGLAPTVAGMNRTILGPTAASLATLLLVAACSAASAPASPPSSSPTSAPATQPAGGGVSVDPGASVDPGTRVDPGGTGDGTDDCSVFTLDRLAAAVGQPVHLGDQSTLFGMGCRWDTADGKGGVVIQRLPVHAGYGDITGLDGQHPLSGVGDGATIGPGAFFGANGDGPFDGKLAAALVGDGFASIVVAPPPSDDAVVGLLKALVDATR